MATRYTLPAHTRGSDHYADRAHPGHTLWPAGVIIEGLTRAEARVIVTALNTAVAQGALPAPNHPGGKLYDDPPQLSKRDAVEKMLDESETP